MAQGCVDPRTPVSLAYQQWCVHLPMLFVLLCGPTNTCIPRLPTMMCALARAFFHTHTHTHTGAAWMANIAGCCRYSEYAAHANTPFQMIAAVDLTWQIGYTPVKGSGHVPSVGVLRYVSRFLNVTSPLRGYVSCPLCVTSPSCHVPSVPRLLCGGPAAHMHVHTQIHTHPHQ